VKIVRLAAILAALIALLSIAACGDDDDDGGGQGAADSEKVGQAKAQGDVTWCIGKDTTGAFSTVVENFNKENPNANAKLLELPAAADEQRRLSVQRLEAESPECDVYGTDVIYTAEFAAQGWLLDMTDAVEKRKEAGNEPPESWQAMYESAKKENGIVYQGARYEGLTVNFLELVYSAGGEVVNEDVTEATADSPEVREVLTFMRDGIEDGAAPKAVTTYMEPESERAFTSGGATFMRNWPYVYALAKDAKIADDFQVSTFPEYDGNEGAGVLGGYNLAISAFSENPEGALAFINFATSPDAQVIQATKASLPAVLTDVYDDPQVQKALPFATELRDAVEQARPRPVTPVYAQVSEVISTNVFEVLQGNASPDEAASTMNDEIQEALETF
jgi:multiple sugar transport system substrate-binding protein